MRIIAIRGYTGQRWLIRYAYPAPCGCYDIRSVTQLKQDAEPTRIEAMQAAQAHKSAVATIHEAKNKK